MSNSNILSIVGYVVGGAYGYPQLGAIVGGVVGGIIDSNQLKTSKIDDLKAPKVSFGAPINHVFGHPRHGGNLIWVSDAIEAGELGGDKKGNGGTMTYIRHALVLLGEQRTAGPIRKIWVAGKLVYSVAVEADDETIDASIEDNIFGEVTYYDGEINQMPDSLYESFVGIGNAPAYRGRPTTMLASINCGASGSLPVFTFETAGEGVAIELGTRRILHEFARSDVLLDPATGSFLGGTTVKVCAIHSGRVFTHSSTSGVASSTSDVIPDGAIQLEPGIGNGDKAMMVFGRGGNESGFAVAGAGYSYSVTLSEPGNYIGTSKIRWSTKQNLIAIGTAAEIGEGADNPEGATGNLGNVYVYTLNATSPDLIIPIGEPVLALAMISSQLLYIQVAGGMYEANIDLGSPGVGGILPMPGLGISRIFAGQNGFLYCADGTGAIYHWIDGAWELYDTLEYPGVDMSAVHCSHMVSTRGDIYAVEMYTKTATHEHLIWYCSTVGDPPLEQWRFPTLEAAMNASEPKNAQWDRNNQYYVDGGLRARRNPSVQITSRHPFGSYPFVEEVVAFFGIDIFYPAFEVPDPGWAHTGGTYAFYQRWWTDDPEKQYFHNVYRKRRSGVYGLSEPTLQSVVENLCYRAGYLEEQIDASELSTKFVHAFAITQNGATSSPMQLLSDAYQFFIVESEGVLIFKFYGAGAVREIPFSQLGASFSQPPPNPYPFVRSAEREQPSTRGVRYVNLSNDYQDGFESSDQLLESIQSSQVNDYPIGLTPEEAKQLAIILQQVAQSSLVRVGPLALGPQHRDLEPGDVLLCYKKNGDLVQIFPRTITYDRGLVTLEGNSYDAFAYTSDAVTSEEYVTAVTVRPAPDTESEIFDPPLFSDSLDGPSFWVVAKPVSFPWAGYSERRSPDQISYAELYRSNLVGVFGTCTTVMPDWNGANTIDISSRLTVDVDRSQLSSISRTALLTSRQNLAMIGSEMVQFQYATLVATGVYELSGFIRYLGGTEWVSHGVNERFILIQPDRMNRVAANYSDVGLVRYYKSISLGKNEESVEAQEFAPQAISMKPLAPCNVHMLRRLNGDILIKWHRRTRFQSNALRGIVPLDHSVDAAYVKIFDESTLLRTITVNNTQQATYFIADQITDGAVGSGIELNAQIRQAGQIEGYPAFVDLGE